MVLAKSKGFLLFAMVALVLSLYRHWKDLHEHVDLMHGEKLGKMVEEWKKKSVAVAKGYRPPLWLSLGHRFFAGSIHTMVHNTVRILRKGATKVNYKREYVSLSDGGQVALDWCTSVDTPTTGHIDAPALDNKEIPIVFLHHGICGCSNSHYMKSMVRKLVETRKFRVVVMVARGCGIDLPLTTPDIFNGERTLDMRECLNHIHDENPNLPVFAIGFSLGAGLLGKYMGEEGKSCKLRGAVMVSPSWNYQLKTPSFHFWSRTVLSTLMVSYTEKHKEILSTTNQICLAAALSARTIKEFDEHMAVKLHGFTDIEDYYMKGSPIHNIKHIFVPTLALSSEDDPICSVQGCPNDVNQLGDGVVIAKTKRGGHVCWAEHMDVTSSWMELAAFEWIEHCHGHHISALR